MRKWERNAKNENCIAGYSVSLFSHFAPGSAFTRKLKGFCGLFFRSINKTRNSPKCEKCIVSGVRILWCVSQKHSRNAKYGKCIAGLTVDSLLSLKKRSNDAVLWNGTQHCNQFRMPWFCYLPIWIIIWPVAHVLFVYIPIQF